MGEDLMYLIDTNILIYHINKNIPKNSRSKLRQIFKNHFNISVITKMEFLGFKSHTEKSFKKSSKFLEHADVIGLDDEIVENVISLKRNKIMKLPDAIIAATAKNNNWTLVTRNERDFRSTGLNTYNPFSED
jgi:predicted nucleic acid-binding protein